jgi:hypothetical protein
VIPRSIENWRYHSVSFESGAAKPSVRIAVSPAMVVVTKLSDRMEDSGWAASWQAGRPFSRERLYGAPPHPVRGGFYRVLLGGLAGGPGFQVTRFIQLNHMLVRRVDRNVPHFSQMWQALERRRLKPLAPGSCAALSIEVRSPAGSSRASGGCRLRFVTQSCQSSALPCRLAQVLSRTGPPLSMVDQFANPG